MYPRSSRLAGRELLTNYMHGRKRHPPASRYIVAFEKIASGVVDRGEGGVAGEEKVCLLIIC